MQLARELAAELDDGEDDDDDDNNNDDEVRGLNSKTRYILRFMCNQLELAQVPKNRRKYTEESLLLASGAFALSKGVYKWLSSQFLLPHIRYVVHGRDA